MRCARARSKKVLYVAHSGHELLIDVVRIMATGENYKSGTMVSSMELGHVLSQALLITDIHFLKKIGSLHKFFINFMTKTYTRHMVQTT